MYHIWGWFSITHNCWLFIKFQFLRTWPNVKHTPNEWNQFYRCIIHNSTHSWTTVSVNRHHKQTPFRLKTTVNVEVFSVDEKRSQVTWDTSLFACNHRTVFFSSCNSTWFFDYFWYLWTLELSTVGWKRCLNFISLIKNKSPRNSIATFPFYTS